MDQISIFFAELVLEHRTNTTTKKKKQKKRVSHLILYDYGLDFVPEEKSHNSLIMSRDWGFLNNTDHLAQPKAWLADAQSRQCQDCF